MESFFDSDPGEGNGTPVSVSTNTGTVSVNLSSISVAGLAQGTHLFFLRAQDDTGQWGPARQARFEMSFAGLNVSPVHIDRAEYFVDQDPGPGNGTAISVPVDGLFDSLREAVSVSGIDPSALPLGPHTLFVRMHGSDGIWGPARSVGSGVLSPSAFNFEVSGTRTVTALEYYVDTDPGAGNGTPLPLPTVTGSIFQSALRNLSIDLLSLGPHTLYLRAKDGDNRWGPTHQRWFEIISTNKTISGAEYFVDTDPGAGAGSVLLPADGAFDEGAEQTQGVLNTVSLAEGLHRVYARAQSSDGAWSSAVSRDVSVGGGPFITSISPDADVVNASVTITGLNFGPVQGTNTVTFNGVTATVTSWSSTIIHATVPSGATTGPVVVTVNSSASNTNVIFAVLPDQDGDGLADSAELLPVCVLLPDCDGDGLLDVWEVRGHNGLNLQQLGANPLRKDIFVEIDWMADGTHSHRPDQAALDKVVASFANAPVRNVDGSRGISLHLDVSPTSLQDLPNISFDVLDEADNDFYDVKAANFDTQMRGDVFHYALFAHQLAGRGCTSGIAEIFGNDLVVSLGGLNALGTPCWGTQNGYSVGTIRQQAGTFMHELGHNLALFHGGNEDEGFDPGPDGRPGVSGVDDNGNSVIDDPGEQCGGDDICGEVAKATKPNHISVMNYTFQAGSLITGRVDYSRQRLRDLDEDNLNEFLGVGGSLFRVIQYSCNGHDAVSFQSFPIDWDCNGFYSWGVRENINDLSFGNRLPSFGAIFSPRLRGVTEWDRLLLNFRQSGDFADGVHTLVADQELTAEQAQLIPTMPLPLEVCDGLDNDGDGLVDEDYDVDGDGISDCFDNCPYHLNPQQDDVEGDGFGDACDLDRDNDGLTDFFEQNQSGTNPLNSDTDGDGVPDAQEDLDGDGFGNELEQMAGTDPTNGSSVPQSVTVTVRLVPGLNSISLPVDSQFLSVRTPEIALVGSPDSVDRVLEFDQLSGRFLTASFNSVGQPIGDSLSVTPDRGFFVYAKTSKTETYTALVACPSYDLILGFNHVGIPCAPSGLTAFQLLQAIGDSTVVSSIQRFNPTTGQFETAGYGSNGLPSGVDFQIVGGEGYVVSMKQDRLGFQP